VGRVSVRTIHTGSRSSHEPVPVVDLCRGG